MTKRSLDISKLTKEELDAELQKGWDDVLNGRLTPLEDVMKDLYKLLEIIESHPLDESKLTKEEFDAEMQKAWDQIERGEGIPIEKVMEEFEEQFAKESEESQTNTNSRLKIDIFVEIPRLSRR